MDRIYLKSVQTDSLYGVARKFSDFEKGEIVCVLEESQRKFLAVGKAEMSSKQLDETKKGEVIKNMHYISDNFWEIGKELSL